MSVFLYDRPVTEVLLIVGFLDNFDLGPAVCPMPLALRYFRGFFSVLAHIRGRAIRSRTSRGIHCSKRNGLTNGGGASTAARGAGPVAEWGAQPDGGEFLAGGAGPEALGAASIAAGRGWGPL